MMAHLRDNSLSLKAKGLYSILKESGASEVDFTLQELLERMSDGMTSLRNAIKELESTGYIEKNLNRVGKLSIVSTHFKLNK